MELKGQSKVAKKGVTAYKAAVSIKLTRRIVPQEF